MMDLYREMLIKLDKMITKDELTRMKLYTKDLIATRLRDQIDSCVTLWERLEERRKIGPNDVSYIKNLIRNCTDNRQDLIDVILEYEQVSINNASRSSTSITGKCTATHLTLVILEEHSDIAYIKFKNIRTLFCMMYFFSLTDPLSVHIFICMFVFIILSLLSVVSLQLQGYILSSQKYIFLLQLKEIYITDFMEYSCISQQKNKK